LNNGQLMRNQYNRSIQPRAGQMPPQPYQPDTHGMQTFFVPGYTQQTLGPVSCPTPYNHLPKFGMPEQRFTPHQSAPHQSDQFASYQSSSFYPQMRPHYPAAEYHLTSASDAPKFGYRRTEWSRDGIIQAESNLDDHDVHSLEEGEIE
jgi:hypothetical protein